MVSLSGFTGGLAGGASINIVIRAVDNFSKQFKDASSGMKKLAKAANTLPPDP